MKRFVAIISVFILCTMFSATAYADFISTDSTPSLASESEVMPRAEETGWYYRNNNGMIEKRLWSYTYGKWLTDWIVVGPAPEG